MDDRTQQLILLMSDEEKLRLAKYTAAQLMELGTKFRDARDKLSQIEGVPETLIEQMDIAIESIQYATHQSSLAELNLLKTTGKLDILN